jgi:putative transposase
MKTYQVRIFPTLSQIEELNKLSSVRNDIWNTFADMNEVKLISENKIFTNFDMHKKITELKPAKDWSILNSKAAQRVATELFKSYQSYFILRKKDKTAKPPAKIVSTYFHTLVFNQSGWKFKSNILTVNKIDLSYKTNILDIENKDVKEIRVKFRNNKWLVDIVINEQISCPPNFNVSNKVLALDLGLKQLATGLDTNGNTINVSNKSKKIGRYFTNQVKKINAKKAKCTKDSNRYKSLIKTRKNLFNRKNAQIKQTLHIQSNKLVNMNYKTIVVGDLQIKKLMQIEKNKKSKVSKSFSLSNIAMFIDFLTYKSVVKCQSIEKIDESYTTQLNCLTGKLFESKIELSDRTVAIAKDFIIDRDLNSAANILSRWQSKQLAPVIEPLDLSIVLSKYNLFSQEAHAL